MSITPGEYRGLITMNGVNNKNGKAEVVLQFKTLQVSESGEWREQTPSEQFDISGWFYLTKNDGAVNESAIKQFSAALGLDFEENVGEDVAKVSTANSLMGEKVGFTVANETGQDGRERTRVQWIRGWDDMPGRPLIVSTPAEVKAAADAFIAARKRQQDQAAGTSDAIPY